MRLLECSVGRQWMVDALKRYMSLEAITPLRTAFHGVELEVFDNNLRAFRPDVAWRREGIGGSRRRAVCRKFWQPAHQSGSCAFV